MIELISEIYKSGNYGIKSGPNTSKCNVSNHGIAPNLKIINFCSCTVSGVHARNL